MCVSLRPNYLIASTGETSISFGEDTFHSEEEGPFHLILCTKSKREALANQFSECIDCVTVSLGFRAYREQSVNGKAGVPWGQQSSHRGLQDGCTQKCCFLLTLPVKIQMFLLHSQNISMGFGLFKLTKTNLWEAQVDRCRFWYVHYFPIRSNNENEAIECLETKQENFPSHILGC